MIRTAFTTAFGLDHPIAQAPMGGSVTVDLICAVCEAGGLGMQGVSWHEPDALAAEIAAIRRRTARPFAVNLVLEWDQHARLSQCIDAGAPVISLFWGDPTAYFPKLRAARAKTIVSVGSADEAKRAADLGADAICAQGFEAGGHVWGQVGTMVLLPAVVDAVAPLPVIAAGGIADGRGLAAVLALGGAGAWIGTRFLATPEAGAHDEWKRRIMAARETATVHTELFDLGWPKAPHRVLRNSTYDLWDAAGRPPSGLRPGEGDPVARQQDGEALLRYSDISPNQGTTGEIEAACLYAGQSAGLVRDLIPAGELVTQICAEAEAALARADALRRS
ncbi:MAG: nitronate monooxygenase [Tabrizicola sp.]|uniref:NAD(P)H-dependent flavin oxidoreductase n=1 Tax=Tabrizicola sp. TaxID=2005166 RepID=UPI002736E388|nr:nitronate monooxygenase [Tabrizicola sp.]MDP3261922.1 nitronate monooxygenase [Tabrizicola sp.]MDP3649980.1 nitronate monooxygenase [Paracoccaceae bacterium]MDZ4066171.1 nitronate monooxygenase [Tabrizicola sp.]